MKSTCKCKKINILVACENVYCLMLLHPEVLAMPSVQHSSQHCQTNNMSGYHGHFVCRSVCCMTYMSSVAVCFPGLLWIVRNTLVTKECDPGRHPWKSYLGYLAIPEMIPRKGT